MCEYCEWQKVFIQGCVTAKFPRNEKLLQLPSNSKSLHTFKLSKLLSLDDHKIMIFVQTNEFQVCKAAMSEYLDGRKGQHSYSNKKSISMKIREIILFWLIKLELSKKNWKSDRLMFFGPKFVKIHEKHCKKTTNLKSLWERRSYQVINNKIVVCFCEMSCWIISLTT